jgi:iron complex outermembrane recepter protein
MATSLGHDSQACRVPLSLVRDLHREVQPPADIFVCEARERALEQGNYSTQPHDASVDRIFYIVPTGPGGVVGVTNAGKATIDGFEAQAQSRFAGLGVDFNFAYVHSVLGKTLYVNPNLLPGQGNVPLGPQCPAGTAGSANCFDYGPATTDLSGRATPYSPQLTISGGIEYGFAVPGGALTPRVDYSFTSHQWQTIQELPGDYMTARHIVNAQLTYAHDSWMFQAYGANLLNEIYIAGSTYGPSNFLGNPRQYGLRVAKNF